MKNSIIHSNRNVVFKPAPIAPDWIVEGAPIARNALLSRSADGTACTVLWDCTAGSFNWRYTIDETVHVLEGSVIVSSENTPPKTLEAGDVAFFPAGTVAHWRVESYVRKIAFCRKTLPAPALPLLRMARWFKATMRRSAPAGGSLMEA